ncbi:MAG: hypothetical protein ACMUIA_05580, partial [bacterium]
MIDSWGGREGKDGNVSMKRSGFFKRFFIFAFVVTISFVLGFTPVTEAQYVDTSQFYGGYNSYGSSSPYYGGYGGSYYG